MNLSLKRVDTLPKLAWSATVRRDLMEVAVIHGPWVEGGSSALVEGAWDGPFSLGNFDRSACFFGSGARARDGCLIFVSSTSTTDYLYWSEDHRRAAVTVSNSLPMLLAEIDDELDPQYERYDLINNSIMLGIKHYEKLIPTKNGSVNRLMHANLRVTESGVGEEAKSLPPPFCNFAAYKSYLTESYGRIAANARDGDRTRPMSICSTQSRGYDTTAANAVARQFGVDKVFTVTRGKGLGYFADEDRDIEPNDDGTDICAVLGLRAVPIDRRAAENDHRTEYLFCASMHNNGDMNLQQVSAHIDAPTMLITGCLGEIWSPERYFDDRPGTINDELVRGDLSNHGLTEPRLQAGYVQLALPFIGARNRRSIINITDSSEMEPWRLHNSYDRPIPRRIAEEVGVPRHLFGQLKVASVLEFPPPSVPIGEALRSDFFRHLTDQRLLSHLKIPLLPFARRWNSMVDSTSPRRYVWNYYLQRAVSLIRGRQFLMPVAWRRLYGALFCYCVNIRVGDYRKSIAKAQSTRRPQSEATP